MDGYVAEWCKTLSCKFLASLGRNVGENRVPILVPAFFHYLQVSSNLRVLLFLRSEVVLAVCGDDDVGKTTFVGRCLVSESIEAKLLLGAMLMTLVTRCVRVRRISRSRMWRT